MHSEDTNNKHSTAETLQMGIPVRTIFVFLVATIGTAVVLELWVTKHGFWSTGNNSKLDVDNSSKISSLKFAFYPNYKTADNHLYHVLRLLEKFGYTRTVFEDCDWNLLWAHDYPFRSNTLDLRHLSPHQIVNHFPGIGFITSKVDLSTASLPFMPKAFRLPTQRAEFMIYADKHPETLFVEKHNEHRDIVIRSPISLNLSSSDKFVQEFIQNPFLVDGYKFDVGVYVVLTSIEPLIAYIYTGDVLFRYCRIKYYPFDPNNVGKYVVGDDYLPTWEVPSLIKYFDIFGGSMRAAFDAYVRDHSLNPLGLWTQIEEIIRQTILAQIHNIKVSMRPFETGKFFELLRFDFVIDEKLRPYLMEANMSPNLSSAHFKQNSLLYEQILYSLFNLVGVGSPLQAEARYSDNEEIITAEKNIATNLNDCAKFSCHTACNKPECQLCLTCMKGSEVYILVKAHYEHLHKMDMKRIFPKTVVDPEVMDIEVEVKNHTTLNAWLIRWYHSKCKDDRSWCL